MANMSVSGRLGPCLEPRQKRRFNLSHFFQWRVLSAAKASMPQPSFSSAQRACQRHKDLLDAAWASIQHVEVLSRQGGDDEEDAFDAEETRLSQAESGSSDISIDDHRPRLLLLEDAPIHQIAMSLLVEQAGGVLTVTERLSEAALAVKQQAFDLILTDMGLPDGDGVGLIDLARFDAESKNTQTPIIAVTANAEYFEARCREAGATDVVAKPVSLRQIREWIAALTPREQ